MTKEKIRDTAVKKLCSRKFGKVFMVNVHQFKCGTLMALDREFARSCYILIKYIFKKNSLILQLEHYLTVSFIISLALCAWTEHFRKFLDSYDFFLISSASIHLDWNSQNRNAASHTALKYLNLKYLLLPHISRYLKLVDHQCRYSQSPSH